jgi:hypothetical protein
MKKYVIYFPELSIYYSIPKWVYSWHNATVFESDKGSVYFQCGNLETISLSVDDLLLEEILES